MKYKEYILDTLNEVLNKLEEVNYNDLSKSEQKVYNLISNAYELLKEEL